MALDESEARDLWAELWYGFSTVMRKDMKNYLIILLSIHSSVIAKKYSAKIDQDGELCQTNPRTGHSKKQSCPSLPSTLSCYNSQDIHLYL